MVHYSDNIKYIDKPHLEVNLGNISGLSSGGGGHVLDRHVQEQYAWSRAVFTKEEIDAIINIGVNIGLVTGRTGNILHNSQIRNSQVSFIYPNPHTYWLFDKLANVVTEINNRFFGYDLFSLNEGFQFTRYQHSDSEPEHYSWHTDNGTTNPYRKLSFSLQLSDDADYEGGDLEILVGDEPIKLGREQGVINFFPSYTLHRVTPITKGTRYSLVCWVSGPHFR